MAKLSSSVKPLVTVLSSGSLTPTLVEAEPPRQRYHEVRFGTDTRPLCYNSILLLPKFLTRQECRLLIDAAEQRREHIKNDSNKDTTETEEEGLLRMPVRRLGQEAKVCSDISKRGQ